MWIGGAATAVGVVVIALSLGDSGEVSGRTVLYTPVALLARGRGSFNYREGLAASRGRVPKQITPEEEAAATRRAIV